MWTFCPSSKEGGGLCRSPFTLQAVARLKIPRRNALRYPMPFTEPAAPMANPNAIAGHADNLGRDFLTKPNFVIGLVIHVVLPC